MHLRTAREVNIDHETMNRLSNSGQLTTIIGLSEALTVNDSPKIRPEPGAWEKLVKIGFIVDLTFFIGTGYLTYEYAWWWLIIGLIGYGIYLNVLRKTNASHLLKRASADAELYDRLRAANLLVYRFEDEAEANKYEWKSAEDSENFVESQLKLMNARA